jgi:hypothetical protein
MDLVRGEARHMDRPRVTLELPEYCTTVGVKNLKGAEEHEVLIKC